MLNSNIRILNFDDSIIRQKELLRQYQHQIVDLSDLGSQARHYMNARTRGLISRRIPEAEKNRVTFLGSGDFHHLSELLISRFDQPLAVISFDFHPDWDALPPRYGCGSWVTEVLKRRRNVGKFILLGVSSDDLSGSGIRSAYFASLRENRLEIYPYAHPPTRVFFRRVPENISLETERGLFSTLIKWRELGSWDLKDFFSGLLKRLPVKEVYVSIDKDCLKNDSALTNWEEGKLSLDELLLFLKLIRENLNIAGLDITGDYSPLASKSLFKRVISRLDHPQDVRAVSLPEASVTALNQETNLKILKTLIG